MLVKPLPNRHIKLYLLLIISVLCSALIIRDGKLMGLQLVNDVEYGNMGFFAVIAIFNIIIAYLTSMVFVNSVGEVFFKLHRILSEFIVPFLINPFTIMFFIVCGIWVNAALESFYPYTKVILAIVLLFLQLLGTITVFIYLKWVSQNYHWISPFVLKYNYGVILTVFLSLSSTFYDYTFLAAASFNYSPFIGLPYELFLF